MAVEKDRIDVYQSVLWTALTAVLTVLSVIVLEAFYHDYVNATDAKIAAENRSEAVQDADRVRGQKLERWQWVDKAQGRVMIPIDRAMELTAEEEGKKGGR